MLLKSQRNQIFQEFQEKGLQPTDFVETVGSNFYKLEWKSDVNLHFYVRHRHPNEKSYAYIINKIPGWSSNPDALAETQESTWENGVYGVWPLFRNWVIDLKNEVEPVDLWSEATKAVQLFTSASELAPNKFTIAELGALHGQLRMLAQLFETSELLRDHQAELTELTQTATVKAETFTKKDWQNWIKGAFVSVIGSLELTEEQRQELLALVQLAFGGLFLKQ